MSITKLYSSHWNLVQLNIWWQQIRWKQFPLINIVNVINRKFKKYDDNEAEKRKTNWAFSPSIKAQHWFASWIIPAFFFFGPIWKRMEDDIVGGTEGIRAATPSMLTPTWWWFKAFSPTVPSFTHRQLVGSCTKPDTEHETQHAMIGGTLKAPG